ncbi:MAG: DUF4326 domain-containing protein [Azonexus sp.]|nr:DUF4326 domain-containing protein [Azonexus sp.]
MRRPDDGVSGEPLARPAERSGAATAAHDAKSESLKQYLAQFAGRNAVWHGVAERALREGNDKQIANALTAAKKQFGELTESTLKNSEKSTAQPRLATPAVAARQEMKPGKPPVGKALFAKLKALAIAHPVHVNEEAFDVYIGRKFGRFAGSKWANPYRIGADGTRQEVVDKYLAHLKARPELMAAVKELKGKTLGCFCKTHAAPNTLCHGDVLSALAEGREWSAGMTGEEATADYQAAALAKEAKSGEMSAAKTEAVVAAKPSGKTEGRALELANITVRQHSASGYRERTALNARADTTVAIAADFTTAGERLTARMAGEKLFKIGIDIANLKAAGERLAAFMAERGASSLNVAGNGIYTLAKRGMSQEAVNRAVYLIIAAAHAKHSIKRIVSGGQTGVDIAGAVAAAKLGIPATITLPKGYLQRDEAGVDKQMSPQEIDAQILRGMEGLDGEKKAEAKPALSPAAIATQAAEQEILPEDGPRQRTLFSKQRASGPLAGRRRAKYRTDGLLGALYAMGGIHPSLAADLTGEKSVRGFPPGIFSLRGSRDLAEIAARLFEDFGFHQIDMNSAIGPEREVAELIGAWLRHGGPMPVNSERMEEEQAESQHVEHLSQQAERLGVAGIRKGRQVKRLERAVQAAETRQEKKAAALVEAAQRKYDAIIAKAEAFGVDLSAILETIPDTMNIVQVMKTYGPALRAAVEKGRKAWNDKQGTDARGDVSQPERSDAGGTGRDSSLGGRAGKRSAGSARTGDRATDAERDEKPHGPGQAAVGQVGENDTARDNTARDNAARDNAAGVEKAKEKAKKPAARKNQRASKEAVEAARQHILKTVGPDTRAKFVRRFADGSTGSFTEGDVEDIITLALNNTDAGLLGGAAHESLHKFFALLRRSGSDNVKALLERVAKSPMIRNKLRRLLDGHPEAVEQLQDAEEAVAYMYQFWAAGQLQVGPQTRTLFQLLKDMLKWVIGLVSESVRQQNEAARREKMDLLKVRDILTAFDAGMVADPTVREAVLAELKRNVEAHDKAIENVGKGFREMTRVMGKMVMSAEAVMDATGNPYLRDLARMFHQKAGTEMLKGQVRRSSEGISISRGQAYADGLRQQTAIWTNKLENLFRGYEAEDQELARRALAAQRLPTDPVAKEIALKIRQYFKEFGEYMAERDVRRLDMSGRDKYGRPGAWVKVEMRKDYFPQVFDLGYLEAHRADFIADLLNTHRAEMAAIAENANAELAADDLARPPSYASERARADGRTTVTVEDVVQAIADRILRLGQIEVEEDTSELGMTPMAKAVNRRVLDWLDPDVFDKYKSKNLAEIMSVYTRSIVKRAEYQSRFGPGGEIVNEMAAKALLRELGGEGLVNRAESRLEAAREAWAKMDPDERGSFPTLRSVGQDLHQTDHPETAEADLRQAVAKLEPSFKAVQAMEGTLGHDKITPTMRKGLSWVMVYQSFRVLPLMLFTSFNDVAGISVNSGELGDAWQAFVNGIKGIKMTWAGEKDDSEMTRRAEEWGVVDASSFLDVLGQTHGTTFMTSRAKRMSDWFFKWVGMEGWNRGIRAYAAHVAERTILDFKNNGLDRNDKAAVARFERLYGKGAAPESIKLDEQGRLDIRDQANQRAVMRWVMDSVVTPTAANRTIWGSDPRFQIFMHLKNWTYSYHRVFLKSAINQARLGNYRPILATFATNIPIMIAAGVIKEMLLPGDEPPWMKQGLNGYLDYGWRTAGVLGIPQMYGHEIVNLDPARLFGPTVDQIQDILSIPLPKTSLNLSPFKGETTLTYDHTLLGEALGALPAGNVLRRMDFTRER